MTYNDNIKPIYLQIADRICDEIMNGVYPPGSRIPSVRDYASSMQVNANTMMRTYMYLSDAGIIFNKRGIGFFIQPDADDKIQKLRRETFFNDEAMYFFSRLKSMNVTAQQLSDLYNSFLSQNTDQ